MEQAVQQEAPAPPRSVGAWTLADAPRRIVADTIFDYMNGGGELYLAYRFAHLDVYTYRAEGQPDIVVEIYEMTSPDDTWGLQSEDWTGDALAVGSIPVESQLALYGAGLLRLACGPRYARVMAYEETEASRGAVLELGRSIAVNCGAASAPSVVSALPPSVTHGERTLQLREDRVRFLRSHLVLHSVYYLASENILDLDHSAAAVYAEYRPPGGDHTTRFHALLIRYQTTERASAALLRFNQVYLEMEDSSGFCRRVKQLESGWLAYGQQAGTLAFVFDGPDEDLARALMEAMLPANENERSTP